MSDTTAIIELLNKRFDSIESDLVEKVSDKVSEKLTLNIDKKITESLVPIINDQNQLRERTDSQICDLQKQISDLSDLIKPNSSTNTTLPPNTPRHPVDSPTVVDASQRDISDQVGVQSEIQNMYYAEYNNCYTDASIYINS